MIIEDTNGEERFRSVSKTYFRAKDGILLICDATQQIKKILDSIDYWMKHVQTFGSGDEEIMIVGNRSESISKENNAIYSHVGHFIIND